MAHDEMAPQHGAAESDSAGTSVSHDSFEHLRDALGTGTARPRLSWLVATPTQNWRQTGYQIEAYEPDGGLRERPGQIESAESVLVSWPFAPLGSRERLMIRVRVWDPGNQPSAWSALYPVETGLLTVDAAVSMATVSRCWPSLRSTTGTGLPSASLQTKPGALPAAPY